MLHCHLLLIRAGEKLDLLDFLQIYLFDDCV